MFTQQICRLRLLFAKDSDQNVCTGYLIATGGLDMEDRTLQYTLKTQRRLCVALRQELEAFIEQTTPVLPASEEERD
ncbi:hypothetical protein ACUOFC_52110, partial [Escherichia sp. TWPC-MK]